MTTDPSRYQSPDAARNAVTDRLRAKAVGGPWPVSDLQRQYAYDRLIERLYRLDDAWVVKGATALLARRVAVRHTIDIDLHRPGPIVEVERQLRAATRLDLGDWMRFDAGPSVRIDASGAQASRVRVTSYIGTKPWATFQVDLVADGIAMTAQPDTVAPLTTSARESAPWRAYPLVDHVADKVCAILEHHGGRASTRFKDLIDLVAIVDRVEIAAAPQIFALRTESERRRLVLPDGFDVPDRSLWGSGYRAEARRTVGLSAHDLDAALATVRPFLDPLLSGAATGSWDPDRCEWSDA